ncbi:MAG: PP2C family protein-serine/threonine phosphatase [Bacteroidia bacterium]
MQHVSPTLSWKKRIERFFIGGLLLWGLLCVLVIVFLFSGFSISWQGVLAIGVTLSVVLGLGWVGYKVNRGVQRYTNLVELQAREEVLRTEGRYKALIQYSSDAIWILDRAGIVSYASPSVEKVTGYKPEQLLAEPFSDFVAPEERALVGGALQRQSPAFFNLRFQHREGRWIHLEVVGQPLFKDPLIRGYLFNGRDVTDRLREEELRRQKEAAALRLLVEKERTEYEKQIIEENRQKLEVAYKIIEAKNRDLEESITYASRIQQGLVPPVEIIRAHLPESFCFWRPRDVVSGDFYWFYVKEDRFIYLATADCTGHGVPGAFMTLISSVLLTEAVVQSGYHLPHEVLAHVHRTLRKALRQDQPGSKSQDGMECALILWDKQERALHFAGAGRPLWFVYQEQLQELKADRQGIGGASAPSQVSFTLHTLHPERDTMIYAASDGFQDQFGGTQGRRYMSKRFKETLTKISPLSVEAQEAYLDTELRQWMGENYRQTDDILITGFRV